MTQAEFESQLNPALQGQALLYPVLYHFVTKGGVIIKLHLVSPKTLLVLKVLLLMSNIEIIQQQPA